MFPADLPRRIEKEPLRRPPRLDPELLHALLDALDFAILGLDRHGRVIHANRRARALLALPESSPATFEPWPETLTLTLSSGEQLDYERLAVAAALHGDNDVSTEVHVETDTGRRLLKARVNAVEDVRVGGLAAVLELEEPARRRAREAGDIERLPEAAQTTEAPASGRLVLFAQPIIDILSGRTVLEELLLRVRARDGTLVGPCELLRAAERQDTTSEIDVWVFEQAVRIAARGHPVAVNVSARTIGRAGFLNTVESSLERSRVAPDLITFELTETAVVSDMNRAARFAERLSDMGCHFALDDFGTGYAALTYLKLLPIQYVKIDRDFVRDLVRNRRSRALIAGVVALAEGCGQHTIAEGVEHASTLRMLQDLGVDMAQGFLLGAPAPAEAEPPDPAGQAPAQQPSASRRQPQSRARRNGSCREEPTSRGA